MDQSVSAVSHITITDWTASVCNLYSNGFLLGFNDPSRTENHLLENKTDFVQYATISTVVFLRPNAN